MVVVALGEPRVPVISWAWAMPVVAHAAAVNRAVAVVLTLLRFIEPPPYLLDRSGLSGFFGLSGLSRPFSLSGLSSLFSFVGDRRPLTADRHYSIDTRPSSLLRIFLSLALPIFEPCAGQKERQCSVNQHRRPQQNAGQTARETDVGEIQRDNRAISQHADQRRARPAGDP